MADSSVTFKDATGATQTHDTRLNGGEHRPAIVLGDDSTRIAVVTDPATITGALTTGSQGSALNVNPNAIQKATYFASTSIASGVLTANTRRDIFSIEHAAAGARAVRIRRIALSGLQTTALAGTINVYLYRGTAATTAGTAFTAVTAIPGATAAETVFKTLPTITAATLILQRTPAITPATAGTGFSDFMFYDWQEVGETIPLTLRQGSLDTLSIAIQSTVAQNITVSGAITFTEE